MSHTKNPKWDCHQRERETDVYMSMCWKSKANLYKTEQNVDFESECNHMAFRPSAAAGQKMHSLKTKVEWNTIVYCAEACTLYAVYTFF